MKQTTLFLISLFTFVLAFFLTTEKSENISLTKKTSGAMQALEFWNRSRAFPNKDIPEAGYADALLYSKRNLRSLSERKFSSEEWRSIGPTNFGGRTLVLAINPQNPNTIYAGSASGGLWRTKSAGVGATAWSYVPVKNSSGDYFAVLGVGAVALAPNDTNTLLIGTGEVYGYQKSFGGFGLRTTRGSYGIGILKSIDNGATWTHTLDWSRNQRRGVQDIAFNPNNANIVYAATSEGTYKSADKGNSWTLIHAVEMVTDILIHPVNSETLFVSCGNLGSVNSGVYRSFDGGQTFTRLNGLPPFSGKTLLSFYGASPNVLYADVADSVSGKGLYRSTNLGDTWTSLNTENYASYQGWFSHFAVVHPGDSSKVLCAGVDVFKSTNGGRTLTQKSYWYNWFLDTTLAPGEPEGPSDYSHADHHAYAVHPTNPNIVYLANDGGVFVTTDFGETFSGRNGGY
ncbi:MAG: hypothetical protein KGZ58_03215, partial [Ignavibacteriales bacterium]|nr:hypothetical protein [Ignavibacteriales bacterium]